MFVEQQANAVDEIRSALAAGDKATAERVAHTLKGSSANLGAADLSASAADVEAAIRSRAEDVPLEALARKIITLVGAIDHALPADSAEIVFGGGPGETASLVAPLSQLKKLLENDDPEAAEFVAEARSRLSGILTGAEFGNLNRLVSTYDFAAALQILSSIASRLSLTLE